MTPNSGKKRILPVFVPHLGCPKNCVFCNQRRISGQTAPVTAETVRRVLQDAELSGQTYELAFYGGSFTAIPPSEQERLLGAALPFMHSGLLDGIRVSTRPDAVDDAAIDLLKRYGVSTVELGAQSMRDSVLEASGRGHSAEDTRRASRLLKARGFSLILQMMTGLPGDDDEGALYTAREFIALRPGGVRIYPTVVIKDTELYDMWRAGSYKEHTLEDALRIGSRLFPLFEEAGIPVIRFGLNPSDELSAGDAAAGAYHPALGELVYSRVMLCRARELISEREFPPKSRIELGVNIRDISRMCGQHRENIRILESEFDLSCLKIRAIETVRGNIKLIS